MKVLKRLLFVAVLAITGFILIGCGGTKAAKPAINNDTDLVSYSVVSGLEMIKGGSATRLSLNDSKDEATQPAISSNLDQINEYLGLAEKLLSSDDAVQHTEAASDREGYEKMMTISVMDLAGEKTEYVLYYNETYVDVEEEDDELEIETDLEGIVVLGEVEYTLVGEKEVEKEDDEEETTYKFEIRLDANNYVKIEYSEEFEDKEVEKSFKYEAYNNGVKTEIKVAYENEDDNYILFKQETLENKQKFTYEIYFKDKVDLITKMYIGVDYENKAHIFLETEDKIKDSKAKYNIKEEKDYLVGEYEIDYLDDEEEGTMKISFIDGNNQYEITSEGVTIIRTKPFNGFSKSRKNLNVFF